MSSSSSGPQSTPVGGTRMPLAVLTLAQALGLSGAPLVVLAGGIAGAELAPSEGLASLPLAAMVVGTAMCAAPAALVIRRLGWRTGLVAGAVLGVVGSVLAAVAVTRDSFAGLAVATLLVGGSLAFVMQYRFLAAILAGSGGAERAVAVVLSGGVAAGLLGPELGRVGQGLMPSPWAGSFLALAAVHVVLALLLVVGLREATGPRIRTRSRPGPPRRTTHDRPAGSRPEIVVGVAAGVTAYAVMTLLMTATPVAMRGAGFDAGATARVIQGHVVAMYAPSIVAGALVARYGASRLMAAGLVAMVACALLGLSSRGLGVWGVQLALLGLGWNALFLGATVVLADSIRGGEGFRLQALNESLVFGAQAMASVTAGALVAVGGWMTVNLVALAPLALMGLVLAGLGRHRLARSRSGGYGPAHVHGGQTGGRHASYHHPRSRSDRPGSLRPDG